MKNYIISKGWHYSFKLNSFIPRWPFKISLFRGHRMEFSFMLAGGSMQDQYPRVSKLYGLSFGLNHHSNSFRLQWGKNKEGTAIDIYAYWYNDGVRNCELIAQAQPYETYKARLSMQDNLLDYILFDINDAIMCKGTIKFKKNIEKTVKWRLFPYFGGDQVAKEKVSIYIDE